MIGFARIGRATAAAFALGVPAAAAAQARDPWAVMARRDVQAIHDTLLANHPGPVDPQNPAYRLWLERGYAMANAKAEQTHSFAGYERAVRLYVNGFRDGHADLVFRMEPTRVAWPGFMVHRIEGDQKIRVAFSLPDSGIPEGAALVSCDGQTPDQMLAERVDPYFWNADIPHERWRNLPQLFILPRSETDARFKTCDFRVGGTDKAIDLQWTITPRQQVMDHVDELDPHNELGLRQVDGIWFITIPSFNYFGADADRMRSLIAEIKSRAPELRQGTVVFDVRGNRGGNSEWADLVAAAFWGDDMVNRVLAGFDGTVDWRASPANIAHAAASAAQARRDGQPDVERYREESRVAMARALAKGQQLVTVKEPTTAARGRAPVNPVTGKVFFLTDSACFSSCLQFADTLKRLPNVRHIGLPTDADTVYLDNDQIDLPSGLAAFSYSMKVYRHKARGNNQWYEPDVRWSGGPMTDEAVVKWIEMLR